MYHKLDPFKSDFLTVKVDEFEKQIEFLLKEDYHFLSFSDLLPLWRQRLPLPPKSVMLTFDDGYQNNFDFLLPILKKHRLKATVFLPIGFIGQQNVWDRGSDRLMDWATLKQANNHFEYGLHSFGHRNVAEMGLEEFKTDIERCLSEVRNQNLPIVPVLAYPYGRYHKKGSERAKFNKLMETLGIEFALRIGNTVNSYPFKEPYLLCRLDIRGADTMPDFAAKVGHGRFKIF